MASRACEHPAEDHDDLSCMLKSSRCRYEPFPANGCVTSRNQEIGERESENDAHAGVTWLPNGFASIDQQHDEGELLDTVHVLRQKGLAGHPAIVNQQSKATCVAYHLFISFTQSFVHS